MMVVPLSCSNQPAEGTLKRDKLQKGSDLIGRLPLLNPGSGVKVKRLPKPTPKRCRQKFTNPSTHREGPTHF